jgi:hypothetical protein
MHLTTAEQLELTTPISSPSWLSSWLPTWWVLSELDFNIWKQNIKIWICDHLQHLSWTYTTPNSALSKASRHLTKDHIKIGCHYRFHLIMTPMQYIKTSWQKQCQQLSTKAKNKSRPRTYLPSVSHISQIERCGKIAWNWVYQFRIPLMHYLILKFHHHCHIPTKPIGVEIRECHTCSNLSGLIHPSHMSTKVADPVAESQLAAHNPWQETSWAASSWGPSDARTSSRCKEHNFVWISYFDRLW